jgi:hypothetical protein
VVLAAQARVRTRSCHSNRSLRFDRIFEWWHPHRSRRQLKAGHLYKCRLIRPGYERASLACESAIVQFVPNSRTSHPIVIRLHSKHPITQEMSTKPTLAQAPFDDARADLILQSSGHEPVHFHVSKFILSMASPVFADMFGIPSPPASQSRDEIQVVPLSEDSETLDLSLRHIYPMRPPRVTQLRQTRILAEFARKYQVDALERHVTHYLADAIDHDPVGVCIIAFTYGYKSIGSKATKLSLKLPFSRLRSPHVQYAPAELYGELLMYHAACGEAASAITSERDWFSGLSNFHDFIVVGSEVHMDERDHDCLTQDFIRMPRDESEDALDSWGLR